MDIELDMEGKQGEVKNDAPGAGLDKHTTRSSTAEWLQVWALVFTV